MCASCSGLLLDGLIGLFCCFLVMRDRYLGLGKLTEANGILSAVLGLSCRAGSFLK